MKAILKGKKMKSHLIAVSFAASATLVSGTPFAENIVDSSYYVPGEQYTASPSMRNRADVDAETRLAMAAGSIPRGQAQIKYGGIKAPLTLDRAAVATQAKMAELKGEIPRGESNVGRQF